MTRIEREKATVGRMIALYCRIHCYSPARRDEIRAVMRYAGPRMLLHDPPAALRHLINY